jgi:hypothetical protein
LNTGHKLPGGIAKEPKQEEIKEVNTRFIRPSFGLVCKMCAKRKMKVDFSLILSVKSGGETGIRTRGEALRPHNRLAGGRFRPLSHLSTRGHCILSQIMQKCKKIPLFQTSKKG